MLTSNNDSTLPVRVVLFRSLYETNVGSVSRVMSNMGAQQLILVDRKCSLTFKAQQAAATGQSGLQERMEVDSIEKYLEISGNSLRIAFTCRDGKHRQLKPFREALTQLPALLEGRYPLSEKPSSIDLVFGPEDAGLSCDEVDACHLACSLDTFGKNSSLNLSHAVLLAVFQMQSAQVQAPATTSIGTKEVDDFPFPAESLKSWLWESGFDVVDRPVNAYTVLKRWLLRAVPTGKENRILETVLRQGIRKMQEYNQSRRAAGLSAGFSPRKQDPRELHLEN